MFGMKNNMLPTNVVSNMLPAIAIPLPRLPPSARPFTRPRSLSASSAVSKMPLQADDLWKTPREASAEIRIAEKDTLVKKKEVHEKHETAEKYETAEKKSCVCSETARETLSAVKKESMEKKETAKQKNHAQSVRTLSSSEPINLIESNPWLEKKMLFTILFFDDVAGLLADCSRTFSSELAALRYLYDFIAAHSAEDNPASIYNVKRNMCVYFAKKQLKLVMQSCNLHAHLTKS